MLIGSDMAMGHPLSRMVDGRWVSTHVSDWLGTFALYLSRRAQLAGDEPKPLTTGNRGPLCHRKAPRDPGAPPGHHLVRKDEQFWIDVLVNATASANLSSYRLLAEDEEVEIYLRKDYVAEAATDVVCSRFVTRRSVRLMRPPFFSSADVEG